MQAGIIESGLDVLHRLHQGQLFTAVADSLPDAREMQEGAGQRVGEVIDGERDEVDAAPPIPVEQREVCVPRLEGQRHVPDQRVAVQGARVFSQGHPGR